MARWPALFVGTRVVSTCRGDQVLLTEEPFRDEAVDEAEGVVQLVWAPGPNPCRTCWEADDRFFTPA
jgi:hypothetical protein